jgi:UDP-N-acetylmuramate dehydrogenase
MGLISPYNLLEMEIQKHFSLKKHNSFGIGAFAAQLVVVKTVEELQQACLLPNPQKQVLGGGSNVLLTGDLPGLTIKNEIGGIQIVDEMRMLLLSKLGVG